MLKNMSYKYKILLILLLIGLIPVILIGSFSYYFMHEQAIDKETSSLNKLLEQEIQSMDNRLNSYLSSIQMIAWNKGVRSVLSGHYTAVFDMYLAYRDVIDPIVTSVPSIDKTVKSITIYSDTPLNPHGNILLPLSKAKKQEWYSASSSFTSPTFTFSADYKKLYLIYKIFYYDSSFTNLICFTIDSQALLGSLESLYSDSYGVMLKQEDQALLFSYDKGKGKSQDQLNIADTPERDSKTFYENYVIESRSLTSVPWTLYLYRPTSVVTAPAKQIAFFVILAVLLIAIIIVGFSLLLSAAIFRPIKELSNNMKLIEQDNLEITVFSDSTDEIGILIQTFTHMVERLKYLINEVLRGRIVQQDYEFKALQAQINPHFFYNSLSLINSKAILAGQEDISRMAQLLSTFYRTTVNKGNSLTTVKDELNNIYSYIDIQRIMRSDSFEVVYEIDNGVLPYKMPNLLIQPLVENAILHGLDYKLTSDKKVLTVYAYKEDDDLVFRVMDNGCGMSKEKCQNILSNDSTGYGIKNVHQRVQLTYGEAYGLTYTSTVGVGTSVILRIKADIPNLTVSF